MKKKVLVVDDDPLDQKLIKSALVRAGKSGIYGGVDIDVVVADDGRDALDKLEQGLRPDVIVLDLRMPRLDGMALLSALKADAELRTIPAIVLSTADANDEVRNCYERHANAYITKPDDPEELRKIAQYLCDFWLGVSRLAC